VRNPFHHRRRQYYRTSSEGGLSLTSIGDVGIVGRLGEGVSCIVYDARWRGRDVALKLYKAGAVERHARLLGEELAEFEYRRNRAFYDAPAMRDYVAEPLAFFSDGCVSAFLQERLEGELYYFHYKKRAGAVADSLGRDLEKIVEGAHAAGLYDVDLHAGNVMVVERQGRVLPKLFDFNFIPFYVHPPNPLVWLGVRTGLVDPGSRDRRKLRKFHDFRRFERKLARTPATGLRRGNPDSLVAPHEAGGSR
jgi:hypothetical protein